MRGSSGLELFLEDWQNSGSIVVPVSADYDGDGVEDVGSWRPSDGTWVLHTSGSGFLRTAEARLGSPRSIPVPADYDGDGTADLRVFDPDGYWTTLGGEPVRFGLPGDIPVPSDYDGDGLADMAVYRPSNGAWYVAGQSVVYFGGEGDVPVPADYDGDGQVDLAVYRPSTSTWYVGGQFKVTFGQPGDCPVPLDVDGDGRTEIVVHRASEGTWYLLNPETGSTEQVRYGEVGDIPVGMSPFLTSAAAAAHAYSQAEASSFLPIGFPWSGVAP